MAVINGYCKEKDIDFNKDLTYGKLGETLANEIFQGNFDAEVKTERNIWESTGNIAIEYLCKGKPSGISTCKSQLWIHFLSVDGNIKSGFIFNRKQLKEYIKNNFYKLNKTKGGDNKDSDMVLLNSKNIMEVCGFDK